jgi:hypothetical protein
MERERLETAKVIVAAVAPWLTAEYLDLSFKILASAGAAFYIWRKIYRDKD